ncbi:MAG TPA: glycine--tRNA ligase subunit beta [Bryobacteraceae bacterium]|nr:glycine--tRNA ligase subunit beta [Bryobacteraceae bacterium]
MAVPFLLEIGVEEIPDWMIRPALDNLRDLLSIALSEHNLGGIIASTDATPRRLTLRAEGLSPSQPDEVKSISGPPVASGQGAAQGFARKLGITVDELQKQSTPKGDYYSFDKLIRGRGTAEVLSEVLPGLIGKIYFPKAMYWTGKSGIRFIRPIRWLVCLLGDEVVSFEIAGVSSGNVTRGHRIIGSSSLPVSCDNYAAELRANGVILSAQERRRRIESGIADLLGQSGKQLQADEELLETLVFLTEFPTPILGSFDPSFLELPREILSTVMRHHQRYFSLLDSEGKLSPEFIAVMNTDADPEGLVRTGNERVLRARFNDARFFWDFDLSRHLESRIEGLKNVTFQAKLGSYFDKTHRNVALAREIAAITGASEAACSRAAELAKCDLTTEMVKEFTELQGVVGGLYARANGEPEEVWQAIYEHYQPVSMEDPLPRDLTGQVVSLADKVDTLRGCFEIGLIPTGSRDPFALRRAAQGVVRLLAEGKMDVKLSHVVAGNEQLREFLLDRIRYYLRDVRGYAYDEVNAVLASGDEDLKNVMRRLEAVKAVRPTENFEPLAASFKRIRNILRQAGVYSRADQVDPALLEPGAEQDLYEAFNEVAAALRRTGGRDYMSDLQRIASIRPSVDKFFDKVLVNAPDERVRQNRLLLLNSLLSEFSTIADFSEIVISQ